MSIRNDGFAQARAAEAARRAAAEAAARWASQQAQAQATPTSIQASERAEGVVEAIDTRDASVGETDAVAVLRADGHALEQAEQAVAAYADDGQITEADFAEIEAGLAALDALAERPSYQEVSRDPELAATLGRLATSDDPSVQEQLQSLASEWAEQGLEQRLSGEEGGDAVSAAVSAFRDDMQTLANATGLGTMLQDAGRAALEGSQARIEEASSAGEGVGQRVLGFFGDIADNVFDVLGAAADFTLDVAGDVVAGSHQVTGTIAAAGADVLGQHAEADAIRAQTNASADAIDRTFDAAGDAVGDGLDRVGDIAETTANVVGEIIDDGPQAVAERLADGTLGPEDPAFAGQVGGYTGILTNRLSLGESVMIAGDISGQVSIGPQVGGGVGVVSAEAGAAAYVGATLSGGAELARSQDGMIELTLHGGMAGEVGVAAEADVGAFGEGASAEAGVSAGVGASAGVTLTFDPANAADVARLQALLEPTPARLAMAVTNPAALATFAAAPIAEAMRHNLTSTTFAVEAGAQAGADAGVGLGPVLEAGAAAGVSLEAGGSLTINADGTTEITGQVAVSAAAGINGQVGFGAVSGGANASAGAQAALTIQLDRGLDIVGVWAETDAGTSASVGGGLFGGLEGERSAEEGDADGTDASPSNGGQSTPSRPQDIGPGQGRAGAVESGYGAIDQSTDSLLVTTLTADGEAAFAAEVGRGVPPPLAFANVLGEPGYATRHYETTESTTLSAGLSGSAAVVLGGDLSANVRLGNATTTVSEEVPV